MSKWTLGDRSEYENYESLLWQKIDMPMVDKLMFQSWQQGYTSGRLAEVHGLAKSTVQKRIRRVGEAMREYVRGCERVSRDGG